MDERKVTVPILLLTLLVSMLTLVQAGCGSSLSETITLTSSERRKISSPNYPSDYPSLQTCRWKIVVQPGKTVGYWFDEPFHLESTGCILVDRVVLYDGETPSSSNRIGKYCGSLKPDAGTTTSRYLVIEFYSDLLISYSGFRLNVAEGYVPPSEWNNIVENVTKVIIGISVGVLVVLLITIGVCIYCCCCKQRGQRGAIMQVPQTPQQSNFVVTQGQPPPYQMQGGVPMQNVAQPVMPQPVAPPPYSPNYSNTYGPTVPFGGI